MTSLQCCFVIHANCNSELVQASKKAKKAGKKGLTGNENDEGGDAYIVDPQSSSSCTSEDGDVDGNAKSCSKKTGTRASRGAATDPQSLYARVSTQYQKVQNNFKGYKWCE